MSLLLLLQFEVAVLKSQVAELTLEVPELSSGELRLTFTTACAWHSIYYPTDIHFFCLKLIQSQSAMLAHPNDLFNFDVMVYYSCKTRKLNKHICSFQSSYEQIISSGSNKPSHCNWWLSSFDLVKPILNLCRPLPRLCYLLILFIYFLWDSRVRVILTLR